METADNKFEMTVDLNVLENLGINLYSNIAAVLTEAVANAWDADASSVQIRVDPNNEWIEIEDDGIGMSVDDLNGKYLRVGYRRRDEHAEHGRQTVKGRPGQTYVDKLRKILREQNVTTPDIEVVFVLGKAVDEEATNPGRLKSSMESIAVGSRIVHYDTLIRGAQEAYSGYIDQTKALDKLENIVNKI